MTRHNRLSPALTLVAGAVLSLPTAAQAQWENGDWCRDHRGNDREHACEVRDFTLSAGSLTVDAGANGGVQVRGQRRSDIQVQARVQAHARSIERAEEILAQIEVLERRGELRAEGPNTGRRESWSVSYRVLVPETTDLDLETNNGGIGVEGVTGRVRFQATNGGIRLTQLNGDVRGETQNGGLHVELTGAGWDGTGLDVSTQNGGVHLTIPEGYSADLETSTVNGGFNVDFPITMTGRIGRQIRTQLGNGGAPVRVTTINGGVKISRR